MASQTEIVNNALTALGLKRVLSIDDESESAIVMKTLWTLKRDAELQAHAWSFAITRASLPAMVSAPEFGYAYQYQLPSDYLSMVEVGEDYVFYTPTDQRSLFAIEGRKILTDEGAPLRIRYVRRIENAGEYSPMFANALAYQLAMDACQRLTESSSKEEMLAKKYTMAIADAKRSNNIEKPPQKMPDDSWWLARQ